MCSSSSSSRRRSVVSDSLQLGGRESVRLLCPWNSPGKNTGATQEALIMCKYSKLSIYYDTYFTFHLLVKLPTSTPTVWENFFPIYSFITWIPPFLFPLSLLVLKTLPYYTCRSLLYLYSSMGWLSLLRATVWLLPESSLTSQAWRQASKGRMGSRKGWWNQKD